MVPQSLVVDEHGVPGPMAEDVRRPRGHFFSEAQNLASRATPLAMVASLVA